MAHISSSNPFPTSRVIFKYVILKNSYATKIYVIAKYEKRMPNQHRHSVGHVRVSFVYQLIPDMLQYILANKTVASRLIHTLSEPLLSGPHMDFLVMSFSPLFFFSFFFKFL